MKEKTLVVLAAGMGSRFGGLKQLLPVGPSGEFIIDYSIYDAIKVGFNKIVFVIKKENQEDFENTIGKRIRKYIKVEYAYQDMNTLPKALTSLPNREKPLGTGHALYCAKKYIKGPFALISADDFYGRGAFEVLSKFLDEDNDKVGILGHNLMSTINNPEGVKRGIIFADNDKVNSIVECQVIKRGNIIEANELQGNRKFKIDDKALANMLIYAFNVDVFPILEKELIKFLDNANLEKDEFYLTDVIDTLIKMNKAQMLKTDAKWMGMTYKEDAKMVSDRILDDIKKNIYKDNLWS